MPSFKSLLAKDLVVFGMASYPKPNQTFRDFYGKRPIVKADANSPVLADFF